jgi:hypothetical protein
LLFPAIGAASILLTQGWFGFFPNRRNVRQAIVTGVSAVFVGIAVYVPFLVIAPVYAQPSSLSQEEVSHRVSQQVEVRFENQVKLLGHALDRVRVEPGELLWVTLCWMADEQLETDYFVFAQLLVDNDLIAAQKDTYHGLGSYPTSQWVAGAMFCDDYPLRVAETAPAPSQGVISVGLYHPTGERLQAYDDEFHPLGDNVRFPGPRIVLPEEGRALPYQWGHQIALVDYRLDRSAVTPGESLELTLYWRAVEPMTSNYAVTVQVMDVHGTKIGQSDTRLSTSDWRLGPVVEDHRSVEISPEAAVGVYEIKVGVYEPATVENLTLYREGQVLPGGGLLTLSTLRVLAH